MRGWRLPDSGAAKYWRRGLLPAPPATLASPLPPLGPWGSEHRDGLGSRRSESPCYAATGDLLEVSCFFLVFLHHFLCGSDSVWRRLRLVQASQRRLSSAARIGSLGPLFQRHLSQQCNPKGRRPHNNACLWEKKGTDPRTGLGARGHAS